MDAPAFDTKRFVWPALRSIVFCLLAFIDLDTDGDKSCASVGRGVSCFDLLPLVKSQFMGPSGLRFKFC